MMMLMFTFMREYNKFMRKRKCVRERERDRERERGERRRKKEIYRCGGIHVHSKSEQLLDQAQIGIGNGREENVFFVLI